MLTVTRVSPTVVRVSCDKYPATVVELDTSTCTASGSVYAENDHTAPQFVVIVSKDSKTFTVLDSAHFFFRLVVVFSTEQ